MLKKIEMVNYLLLCQNNHNNHNILIKSKLK